jgi:exosome complex component RRP4
MGITIVPPVVEDFGGALHDDYMEGSMEDSDGDIDMENPLVKRPRLAAPTKTKTRGAGSGIVVPGELVTDDPQWMR